MTKRIAIGHGLYALVDAADFEAVSAYKWHRTKGTTNRTFYAATCTRGSHETRRRIYMHRLVMGLLDAPRSVHADHINGDTLDNRRCNLRLADARQNGANRVGSASRSGFKGVFFEGGRWAARCGKGAGSRIGKYDTEEVAARAYDAAARTRYGEFARLNFPGPGEAGAVVRSPVSFDRQAVIDRHRVYAKLHMRKRRQQARDAACPPSTALDRAISLAGCATALAEAIGTNRQHISWWRRRSGFVSGEFAVRIEAATGGQITCHELRPDLYPVAVAA